MVKIQFEIVSPKKWLINRKVKKQEARVEKAQTKLDTLRAKQQKIYGSDEVTETKKETVTEKTVTQKVNSLTAGTYFVESKNVIPMREELKRLGLNETHTVTKTAGIDHGVFPRKDKNGKVIGSTNKFNEAMTQNKTLMVLVKNGKASAWDRSKQ